MPLARLLALATAVFLAHSARGDEDLRTVAEKSDYKATARHADVVELCKKLAAASKDRVKLTELGKSPEGRSIPLLIAADPPVATPEEARKSGKLVVFIIANIHAGEVCGKEAMPAFVREMITTPDHPAWKDFVLLIAPIYNVDGNEKVSPKNRPGQKGPDDGMGIRANGQGLDLNRDFVKLEAPETRGFVRILNEWDPHLFFDLHTTNGSHHRYLITYQGPKNPAGDDGVLAYTRDRLMPGAGAKLKAKIGADSFFYGNFDRDYKLWTTYGATPRFGTTYVGLRDRISVLSEAYAYAEYKDRIVGTLEFVRGLLEYAAAHKGEILMTLDVARKTRKNEVAIRSDASVSKDKVTILGFEEEEKNGRQVATDRPREYTVGFEQDFVPTATVKRPYAYVVSPRFKNAIENLKLHGLPVEILEKETKAEAEVYRVDAIKKAPRPFEGHVTIDLEVTPRVEGRAIEAGSAIVPADGPLGTLAIYLLEPRSDDGLATWNFFDESLKVGEDFPVLRLLAKPQ